MSDYRDPHQPPRWLQTLDRISSASFRLGVFFRVEVRVAWITLFLTPLILYSLFRDWELEPAPALTLVLGHFLVLYAVVWFHEMGHIVAGRRYGIPTPLITLSPLGGLAHMAAPAPSPRAEIVVSASGPATHLLLLAVFWPLSLLLTNGTFEPEGWRVDPVYDTVQFLVTINLWLMIFNLLPVYPLDGGRILRAALALRIHPNRATIVAGRVGVVGGAAFIAWGLFASDLWRIVLILIGINGIIASLQAIKAARYIEDPYSSGERLEPWQTDPDAWKRGMVEDPTPKRREQKKAKKSEAKRQRKAVDDAELDRILARIGEVGLDGLEPHERKLLDRASRERRDTGS